MDIREKIKQRRLQLLVHSCIYYKLDRTIVSDETWNKWSEELKQLQLNYPDASKEVEWYDAFKDWDGSTGAFLPIDDEWVLNKAHKLLAIMDRKIPVPKFPRQCWKSSNKSLLRFLHCLNVIMR